jgi:hypothetical protein
LRVYQILESAGPPPALARGLRSILPLPLPLLPTERKSTNLAGLLPAVSIAGGIAAGAATVASAASKYVDERREQKLSDLYFLWAAVKHRRHEE